MTSNGPTLARTCGVYSLHTESYGLNPLKPGLFSCSHHCSMALVTCREPRWVLVHMDTIHPVPCPGDCNRVLPRGSDATKK